ncbi:hypothetical protein M422DRAFT_191312, partial [Sphaerobolus stellatus SS14]
VSVGMKKNQEAFFFFSINNAATFKSQLALNISKIITSATQLLSVSTQPITAVNVAFSKLGLDALGVTDDLGDVLFSAGQKANAGAIGDNLNNWEPAFLNQSIHGVFLVASDSVDNVHTQISQIRAILGNSISEVYRLGAAARPGDQQGHEHFGFLDGISQPALQNFNTPLPGQVVVPPGIIIVGADGDAITTRPSWATGGSFLAFRQLKQLVPEFNAFLAANPLPVPGLTPAQGSALLGARMIGRWPSGAPVDLSPLADDPALGADPTRNNNFTYMHDGFNFTSDQTHCPFAAHTRKSNPRADLPATAIVNKHIIRSGIPYGPEVTGSEATSGITTQDRGLAFVAYQSDISNGFFFLQANWFDNPNFIVGKSDPTPGWDPILGQILSTQTGPRFTSGLDPTDPNRDLTLPDFIISEGGEYFFSPPISALVAGMEV